MKRKYSSSSGRGEDMDVVVPYKRRSVPRPVSSTTPYRRQAMGMALQRLNPTISRPYGSVLELKSFDTQFYQGTINPTGVVVPNINAGVVPSGSDPGATAFGGYTCINEMLQNSNFFNRIGTRVTITSINLDGVLLLVPPDTGPSVTTVRVSIIYDRQPNQGYPLFSSIFAINDEPPVFTSSINIQNRSRFMIIRDQYFNLDTSASLAQEVHLYAKTRLDCEYATSTGAIGDITTGAVYVMIISGSEDTAGKTAFVNGVARVRYMD